ncbi:MAG TPA: DUF2179 domain-containing protein [Sedimentisphaerales bacterium]|nr:DUF2179 domain-containing protein [Sedimentisphaerales bacterium]
MLGSMLFFNSETFTLIILPLLIFFARIFDVTIGTMRIIFVSRGAKIIAPLLGFFEVLIWLVAIGKVMQNLDNISCYIAYGGGFAAGNFIGIWIEEKLAMGSLMVQVISKQDASELIDALNCTGYGATSVPAYGKTGEVQIVHTIIRRSDLKDVVEIIRRFNPRAFYTIGDVRFVKEGVFPLKKSFYERAGLGLPKMYRKGK